MKKTWVLLLLMISISSQGFAMDSKSEYWQTIKDTQKRGWSNVFGFPLEWKALAIEEKDSGSKYWALKALPKIGFQTITRFTSGVNDIIVTPFHVYWSDYTEPITSGFGFKDFPR